MAARGWYLNVEGEVKVDVEEESRCTHGGCRTSLQLLEKKATAI